MIFKNFKVLGILLLLLAVFTVGGKKFLLLSKTEISNIQYITLTGGSSAGNYMHLQKTIGVLKALAEKDGLTYSEDVEKLAYTVEDVQKRMEEK